jgi:GMP synthase-like glutamine amidotransferase
MGYISKSAVLIPKKSREKVLFIQHGETDKPGLFAESVCRSRVALEVACPYSGEALPASLDLFDGLAVGGGAQGAYEEDKYPYLSQNQLLFRYGCGLYGLQFHLEMTPEIFEEMLVGSDDYIQTSLNDLVFEGAASKFNSPKRRWFLGAWAVSFPVCR